MITTPQEQEAKTKKAQVLVDLDVVETSFEKWAKPGHFSRTLAKGPKQQHGFEFTCRCT
jgi:photosystem I P700 chlorophyll a apoprotein A1